MKVDLNKYEECLNYINSVNNVSINDLEFYRDDKKIKIKDFDKLLKEWIYTGLDNKGFIELFVLYPNR